MEDIFTRKARAIGADDEILTSVIRKLFKNRSLEWMLEHTPVEEREETPVAWILWKLKL